MKYLNLTIFRYLSKYILLSFVSISLILSLILFGNQFFIVLSKSIGEGLFLSEVAPLIIYKLVRDLPLIISLSFSISIIYSLNKLYKSSELIIFSNAGIGDLKIYRIIIPIVLIVSVLVLLLTNFIVPYAKNEINILKENAKSRPQYIFFKEGVFQEFKNLDTTFFSPRIESIDGYEQQKLYDVFIFSKESSKLILAEYGVKFLDEKSGNVYLNLANGKIYENINTDKSISITLFKELSLMLFDSSRDRNLDSKYISNTQSSSYLIQNLTKENLNELLSRFSIAISILIISFINIVISRVNPRQSKNYSVGFGFLMYLAYYYMLVTFSDVNFIVNKNVFMFFLVPHIVFIIMLFVILSYKRIFS